MMKDIKKLLVISALLLSCSEVTKESEIIDSKEENVVVLADNKKERLKLTASDLNVISFLTVNDKTEYFEEGKTINEYFKIELIDKTLFNKKKNTVIDFLITDTSLVKKKGDTLELEFEIGLKQYIDMSREYEENTKVNNYIGYVDFLNQYLIMSNYYESFDFKFLNKNNGEQTQVFGGYPNISSDSNSIVCLEDNIYETTADLEIYSIINSQILHQASMSFKYWMPYEKFFSSDGYLYVSVSHIASYNWTGEGDVNNDYQYIRLKLI